MKTDNISEPLFRVIVAGGRDFDDCNLLKTTLDQVLAKKNKTHNIINVSRKACGADTLGFSMQRRRGIPYQNAPQSGIGSER